MQKFLFKSALRASHLIMQSELQEGSVVADATCGKGNDTLFLANLVGPAGRVYAFDIQTEAINFTTQKLSHHNLLDRVQLIKDSHEKMDYYINEALDAVMFNLGYLPGVQPRLITLPNTTLIAVQKALNLLKLGGLMTIVFYLGHAGGQEELDLVKNYLTGLPQKEFEICHLNFINQINNPPQLIAVKKLGRGLV